MQMPQLIGVAHHIDGSDPAILDVERGRLELAVSLARDETGQAADLVIGSMEPK
jgi:hypothetical protein